uniref:Uncharacterized protein n=1 Tax=Salix viminalis TaxID=40686 RepID=A0A6N2LI34_SALVM
MKKAPITTNTKRLHSFRPLALPHKPILSLNASYEALWKALISGIGPSSSLYDISTDDKLNRSLKELGIIPESMFSNKFEHSPSCFGIDPLRLLEAKLRIWREENTLMYEGMVPERWLLLRVRLYNSFNPCNSVGMVPCKWFEDRSIKCNRVAFPSSGGISPETLLFEILRLVMLRHSPHLEESSP